MYSTKTNTQVFNILIILQVKEGDTTQFSCEVKGKPTPEVMWYFYGHQLQSKGRYRITHRGDRQVCVLYVTDVQLYYYSKRQEA